MSRFCFLHARVVALLAVAAGALVGQAPEKLDYVRTQKGIVFKNVQILAVEPDGLRLQHEAGVNKVAFADLPESLARLYPYDAEKAADFAAKSKAASLRAIQMAEQEREQADYDELCRRAGVPVGFTFPREGPITLDHVKGQWLLDNAADVPAFHEVGKNSRELEMRTRKELILSGALDREAEKIALRHNLDWYVDNNDLDKADLMRQRLADLESEKSKEEELAILERLANSLAQIAAESSRQADLAKELARIRSELERIRGTQWSRSRSRR